jgi:hypothetical protein
VLALIKAWLSANVFRVNPHQEKFVILRFIDLYYKGQKDSIVGLRIQSGDDEYPGNKIVAQVWRYSAYISIPKLLKPFRAKRTFTTLSPEQKAKRIEQYGHLNYFEIFDREYGFHLMRSGIHWSNGAQTHDSITSKSGYVSFPWTEFDLQSSTICGADGIERVEPKDYKASSNLKDSLIRFVFLLRDHDGEEIRAYCYLEKRVYRVGTGWIKKYFGAIRPRRTFLSMDIRFDGETGTEKGSWKGGTVGAGVLAGEGDKFEAQYLIEKYCAGQHRAKGNNYSMTLLGREPDSVFTHEMYRKAAAERRGEVYTPA